MEEHVTPSWLNSPPPLDPKDRLLTALRRYGFLLVCAGLVLLFGVLLYAMSRPAPGTQEIDVEGLIAHAEAERRQRLAAASSRSEPSTLSVLSYPEGATVFLDRDSVGTTPLRAYPVSSGAHVVSISKGDLASPDTLVFLQKGRAAALSLRLRPDARTPAPERIARSDASAKQTPGTAMREATSQKSQAQEKEGTFVQVSTETPATRRPQPQAAEPAPMPKTAAARKPADVGTNTDVGADSVVWVESEAERQQRLSSYVQEVIEQRQHTQPSTASTGAPIRTSTAQTEDPTLEAQQEQAREIIRKHQAERRSGTDSAKAKKKRRGW